MRVLPPTPTRTESDFLDSPTSRLSEELVIREARRREHRRWLGLGITALVIVGAGLLLTIPGGNTPSKARPTILHSSPLPPAPAPSASHSSPSVSLPLSDLFNQITVAQGHLLLSGEVASPAALSGKAPSCVSAIVNPKTLAISSRSRANCNDPASYGETVGVVGASLPDSNNATISIARVDPRTGHTSVSPAVMTYGSYSDTRPVSAYGGGWLWIYDNSAITSGAEVVNSSNPGTAELLQVSTSSGQVVNTVSMPDLSRPILAANDAGLWVGNSIQGGISAAAMYFVAPGSHTAAVAISDPSSPVCWLLGSDQSLWVGLGERLNGCVKQAIWRLNGADFQPVFEVQDQGYHPSSVVGDEADGLWTTQWTNHPPTTVSSSPSGQEIVGINPDTGAEKVEATLPPRVVPLTGAVDGLVQDQAAVLDGSLYVLEPPFKQRGYLGYSTLVKVKLRRV